MNRKRGWKKAIADRARGILHAVPFFTPITGDDDEFLRELISLHQEAESKIGVGVKHFEVRPNEWNGRTFWLVRVDGTATDFSFLKAISPPSPMQDFAKACRRAVVDQILAFKNSQFDKSPTLICPITQEPVTADTAHIDHAEPLTFDSLVQAFAATRTDIAADVEPTRDGDLATYFREQSVADEFAEIHRNKAVLRVVSRKANLSILKRKTP